MIGLNPQLQAIRDRIESFSVAAPDPDLPPNALTRMGKLIWIVAINGPNGRQADVVNPSDQVFVFRSAGLLVLIPIGFNLAEKMLRCRIWNKYRRHLWRLLRLLSESHQLDVFGPIFEHFSGYFRASWDLEIQVEARSPGDQARFTLCASDLGCRECLCHCRRQSFSVRDPFPLRQCAATRSKLGRVRFGLATSSEIEVRQLTWKLGHLSASRLAFPQSR